MQSLSRVALLLMTIAYVSACSQAVPAGAPANPALYGSDTMTPDHAYAMTIANRTTGTIKVHPNWQKCMKTWVLTVSIEPGKQWSGTIDTETSGECFLIWNESLFYVKFLGPNHAFTDAVWRKAALHPWVLQRSLGRHDMGINMLHDDPLDVEIVP